MIIKDPINDKEFLCIHVKRFLQPVGNLYSTVLTHQQLVKIAYSNPRVLVGFDDEGKEVYRGIQRALSPARVKEIKSYVKEYEYASFPSSIIINLPHEKFDIYSLSQLKLDAISDDKEKNFASLLIEQIQTSLENDFIFVIPYEESVAQIIDGQHRMSGFNEGLDFQFDLPVTIFTDQIVEQQAEIFSTLNGKQTRVTPSLVYELFGISDRNSPYKTAHNLVKILNENTASPVKGWFKRLGKSNDFYQGYITQSTAVRSIFKLICGNAKQADEDLRLLSRGEQITTETKYSRKEPVLRKFYVADDDAAIIKVLFNYFNVLKRTFENEWDNDESIFKRTIGFTALFKVLELIIPIGLSKGSLSENFFEWALEDILIESDVTLSSKGINELYKQFESKIMSKKGFQS